MRAESVRVEADEELAIMEGQDRRKIKRDFAAGTARDILLAMFHSEMKNERAYRTVELASWESKDS